MSPNYFEFHMAVYSITHSCGCEELHNLQGQKKEHSKAIQLIGSTKCLLCRNDEICSDREAALISYFNLQVLQGEREQILKARGYRFEILNQLEALHKSIISNDAIHDRVRKVALSAIEGIAIQGHAQFWIGASKMLFDEEWLRAEVSMRLKK